MDHLLHQGSGGLLGSRRNVRFLAFSPNLCQLDLDFFLENLNQFPVRLNQFILGFDLGHNWTLDYATSDLLGKIDNIAQQGEFSFSNGKKADNKQLAAFMYKINFLTARKETEKGIVRKYFEENRYLSSSFYDFGFDWEIHPAYRWALQPDDPKDIFNFTELSIE